MTANTPTKVSSSQDANPPKAASIYLPSIACEVVEIRVAKTTMFRVHENVLRQSPFFANALKPEWVSAREGKSIELEDEDPDTFAAYVQWLHSHQVDPEYKQTKWAKRYVLGEKMMDPEFQDSVTNAILEVVVTQRKCPGLPNTISIIYNGTSAGSPARKLLVDLWCHTKHDKALGEYDYARKAPADFVNDLLVGLSVARFEKPFGLRPWNTDRSVYMVGSRKMQQCTAAGKRSGV